MHAVDEGGRAGFTLIEIMIVVAIIGLLAAIALPNLLRNRIVAQANTCISNLRMIDSAKHSWAIESGQATAATVDTAAVNQFIKGSRTPTCPTGKTSANYEYRPVDAQPTCIIVVPIPHEVSP